MPHLKLGMRNKPVQEKPLPPAQVRSLRTVFLLVNQVLALLYQRQLLMRKEEFDLARVIAHPDMMVVPNPESNKSMTFTTEWRINVNFNFSPSVKSYD